MKKIILGFTGLIGSGKGTAAKYIEEKYKAKTFRFSSMLYDLVQRLHLATSRDNLIKMSEIIRSTYGEDIMAKVIADDVKNSDAPLIVVDGIRRMADIEYLQKLPNFVLVEIFADMETRLVRVKKRNEKSDDASKTMEQFIADHKRSTEVSIEEVVKHATERVNNNSNAEDLKKSLDNLMKKYSK